MKRILTLSILALAAIFAPIIHSQSSGSTPPPPPYCTSANAGALYTNTGTSPATVYTCSYYNLAWQWVVNPSYGGLVLYPTVPSTCSGALPVFLAGWPTNTQMYVCVNGVPVPQAIGPPGPVGPSGPPINWRGNWEAYTPYARNDGFIEAGIGYVVITSYTSGATFGSLDTANSVQIATGCAGGVCQIPEGGTGATTTNTPYTAVFAFGDSLMGGNQDGSGITIPSEILADMPAGTTVYNYGIAGQASGAIAVRFNAYAGQSQQTFGAGFTLPTSGTVTVTFANLNYDPVGGYSGGAVGYPSGVPITFTVSGTAHMMYCFEAAAPPAFTATCTPSPYPSSSVSVANGSAWTTVLPAIPANSIFILETGTNNISNGTTANVVTDDQAMVNVVPAGSNYIVMTAMNALSEGMWDGFGGIPGIAPYNTTVNLNASIYAAFPSHVADMRRMMIDNFNVSAANPYAEADQYGHDDGVPPVSLHAQLQTGTLTSALTTSSTSFTTSGLAIGPAMYLLEDTGEFVFESGVISSPTNTVSGVNRGAENSVITAHTSGTPYIVFDQMHLSGASAFGKKGGYAIVGDAIYQMILSMPPPATFASGSSLLALDGLYPSPGVMEYLQDGTILNGFIGGVSTQEMALNSSGSQQNLVPDSGIMLTSLVTNQLSPYFWHNDGSTSFPVVQSATNTGGNAFSYMGTGGAPASLFMVSGLIPVTPGQYTFSAWLNTPGLTSGNLLVAVSDISLSGNYATIYGNPANANTRICPDNPARQCITFTIPSGVSQVVVYAELPTSAFVSNGGLVQAGDFQLEQGWHATSYKVNLPSYVSGFAPLTSYPAGWPTTLGGSGPRIATEAAANIPNGNVMIADANNAVVDSGIPYGTLAYVDVETCSGTCTLVIPASLHLITLTGNVTSSTLPAMTTAGANAATFIICQTGGPWMFTYPPNVVGGMNTSNIPANTCGSQVFSTWDTTTTYYATGPGWPMSNLTGNTSVPGLIVNAVANAAAPTGVATNTGGSILTSGGNLASLTCIDFSGQNTTLGTSSSAVATTGGASYIVWTYTLPTGCSSAFLWMRAGGLYSYYSPVSGTSFQQNLNAANYTAASHYPVGGVYPTANTTGQLKLSGTGFVYANGGAASTYLATDGTGTTVVTETGGAITENTSGSAATATTATTATNQSGGTVAATTITASTSIASPHILNGGTSSSAPACAVTGAGSSATCVPWASAYFTDSDGEFYIASAGTGQAAAGTLTLTFHTALGGNAAICTATPADAGGTAVWSPLVSIHQKGALTTGPVFNWNNNSVSLVAATNYFFSYHCFGQ